MKLYFGGLKLNIPINRGRVGRVVENKIRIHVLIIWDRYIVSYRVNRNKIFRN